MLRRSSESRSRTAWVMATGERRYVLGLMLGLAAALWPGAASESRAELRDASPARGETLLRANCSRCHAIGRTGESPRVEAPPFRTLSRKYPIESLAEALGQGLSVGHEGMPEFVFEPADVGAILGYLNSIQEK